MPFIFGAIGFLVAGVAAAAAALRYPEREARLERWAGGLLLGGLALLGLAVPML